MMNTPTIEDVISVWTSTFGQPPTLRCDVDIMLKILHDHNREVYEGLICQKSRAA